MAWTFMVWAGPIEETLAVTFYEKLHWILIWTAWRFGSARGPVFRKKNQRHLEQGDSCEVLVDSERDVNAIFEFST